MTYHVQGIFILESFATLVTGPSPVVIKSVHMLICCALGEELPVAHVALVSWAPMSIFVHMLSC